MISTLRFGPFSLVSPAIAWGGEGWLLCVWGAFEKRPSVCASARVQNRGIWRDVPARWDASVRFDKSRQGKALPSAVVQVTCGQVWRVRKELTQQAVFLRSLSVYPRRLFPGSLHREDSTWRSREQSGSARCGRLFPRGPGNGVVTLSKECCPGSA